MMELNNISRITVDILSERTAQVFKWYYSCSQSISKMQFQYVHVYPFLIVCNLTACDYTGAINFLLNSLERVKCIE